MLRGAPPEIPRRPLISLRVYSTLAGDRRSSSFRFGAATLPIYEEEEWLLLFLLLLMAQTEITIIAPRINNQLVSCQNMVRCGRPLFANVLQAEEESV